MKPHVYSTVTELLINKLVKIETHCQCDVLSYYGPILDEIETSVSSIIEDLANDINKKDRLTIILTTTGGSAFAVERWVNIIKHHYEIVDFVIPDYAYSAGTIFCMSGDNIFMDYYAVLGPIDPQVQNKDGRWVAAWGYLDKVNEVIEKSRNNTLTEIEYLMIKDLDLAELREYEQAKELTNELLKKWLVRFKFKNWNTHETNQDLAGKPVTLKQKQQRAKDIANKLNDNTYWKSHGRPINIETLRELGLKIEDYSHNFELRSLIKDYYTLLSDFVGTNNFSNFALTRKMK